MKNILIILAALFLYTKDISAQANHYKFEVATDTYTELTGDIPLTQMVFATGDPFEIKDLYGETFQFFNKPWTMDTLTKGILIFPNAFVEVIEPGNFLICDALLRWLDSIDNASKISYKIDGTSGKKIVKVQWKNLRLRTGQPDNFVNLQIWLYQENGMIEYRYGPSSASNASGYTQDTGPSVGISYSPFDFSPMFEKIWISGTPPNITIDSARNAGFPNIWGVPVNSTVYRFAPRSVSVAALEGKTDFSIYPNPANDEIHITTASTGSTLIATLYDMQGRIAGEYQLDGRMQTHTISTKNLSAGLYELRLTANGQTTVQTVEIRR